MADLASIVLAAGEGKRMKSRRPKPLQPVCGKPMLAHVLDALAPLGPDPQVMIVGVGAEEVRPAFADRPLTWVTQEQQLGTGHAADCAREALAGFTGDVLVTCADIPLVRTETWQRVLAEHRAQGAAGTIVTALFDDPTGYGRVIRDASGAVQRIVEEPDCDDLTRAMPEGNVSVYCFSAPALLGALSELQPNNEQGEYYLTDVVGVLVAQGRKVIPVIAEDPEEVLGINDRVQLARAERIARDRVRRRLMLEGVTLLDPDTTYIDQDVSIGRDTVVWPGAHILGATEIGEGCVIGDHVLIENCRLGEGTTVKHCSVVHDSRVGRDVEIGPCAHVRDQSTLEDHVRVGTSSEVKRSRLGEGVCDLHFSYVGDATVGAGANIGAGVITCNYDGVDKHPTIIEDGAFIGSDAALVAPVTIGKGAYVGAGSVITKNVPPGALALGRARQENREGWVEKHRR